MTLAANKPNKNKCGHFMDVFGAALSSAFSKIAQLALERGKSQSSVVSQADIC